MTSNNERNEPYSTMAELLRPFIFTLLGIAIGGCLVWAYFEPLVN